MTDLIQAVSSVGFPIACCCFLLYQNAKRDEYHRKQQEELRKTIDNNTRSIDGLDTVVRELVRSMKGE